MKERIDTILVKRGFFPTRQKAQYAIEQGRVSVEQKVIQKPAKQVEEEANIEVQKESLTFVSRGGLKLEKAIQVFSIEVKGKECMDIGASTGGFTDCLLQHGAKKVYAVDVGHDQLDRKLRQDERVVNLEGTNLKEIKQKGLVDFISADISFISLTQALNTIKEVLKENGEAVVLIKPQFEAGREHLNKNGVVKEKKIHSKVIEKILLCVNQLELCMEQLDYSPIKGPAGNIEYLAKLKKDSKAKRENIQLTTKQIQEVVERAHKALK